MKTILHQEKGFTLIETMVSMLVFTIGLLGVMSMQVMAVKGNSFGSTNTRASTLCVEMIERMINNSSTLNSYSNLNTSLNAGPASGVALNDYRDWSARLSDELGDGAYGTVNILPTVGGQSVVGANTVTVRVAWGYNGEHSIQMSTVISYP